MSGAGRRSPARAALAPLNRPLSSYYLILGTTGMLLAIGLVMVLSTSSAAQLDQGQSPYSVFARQFLGVVVGLVLMWGLSRAPTRLFRAVAYPLLLAAIGSLVLVLAFGTSVDGAKRWIDIAGTPVQPSEFAKLAFLLWGADLLARREKLGQLNDWRTLLIPLLPGAAVLGLLVIMGDDLGTTFLLLIILLALLWVIGTPARLFAVILGLVIFALLMLIVVQPYRIERLMSYLSQGGGPTGPNQQGIQGQYAIGSGGLFGVGLGDSKQKWGWVPNSTNDFIFAILGEELGLIGTCCVVLLYAGLAFGGLRVARRMSDPFMRLAAAAATTWIVIQALVNICAVVGVLPITGIPLPLISAGLSSLLATMAAVGMLLAFARQEPGATEALALVRLRLRLRLTAVLHRHEAAVRPASRPPGRPAGRGPARGAGPAGPGAGTQRGGRVSGQSWPRAGGQSGPGQSGPGQSGQGRTRAGGQGGTRASGQGVPPGPARPGNRTGPPRSGAPGSAGRRIRSTLADPGALPWHEAE